MAYIPFVFLVFLLLYVSLRALGKKRRRDLLEQSVPSQSSFQLLEEVKKALQNNGGRAEKAFPLLGLYPYELRDPALELLLEKSRRDDLRHWLRCSEDCHGVQGSYALKFLNKHFSPDDFSDLLPYKKHSSVTAWFSAHRGANSSLKPGEGLISLDTAGEEGTLSEAAEREDEQ